MKIELLVDFEAFWTALASDLSAAHDYAFVQTFSFEGDSIGRMLADALIASNARSKRILADSFAKIVVSDKLRYTPRNWLDRQLANECAATRSLEQELCDNGVALRYGNPFARSPRRWLKRNHKKLVVI